MAAVGFLTTCIEVPMKRSLIAVLLSALVLTGCATAGAIDERVDFDLATQPTVYRDQWVRLSNLEVHVEPAHGAAYAPRVLFMPFRVTQEMSDPTMAGFGLARVVYQTWLSMRLYPTMEFSGDSTPYRRDRAVQLARQRGADMVVGGFVTYLYPGGTVGDTQVSLQIEGIDVATGQIVWSMAQSGLVPVALKKDYLIFAVKHRMPSDPLHAATRAIAAETGRQMQNWLSGGPRPTETVDRLDTMTRDAIFPNRDAIPAPREPESEQQNSF